MKTLIIPSSKEQFKLNCDGIIIGIKNLSTNLPAYFDLEDLKDINKEIFVCLNKNMHNEDIKLLEETLIKLKDYNIKGVIFYDLAVPNLAKKLNLNYDLVWGQEHMTNNYYTINFWYEHNIKYTWVSNDITLREMNEIKQNTKAKLFVTLFGYLPMFTSQRHLVKNYLKTFSLKDNSKINYIVKEGKTYPLTDDLITVTYTDFILDGLKEKTLLNYDYIILNSFLVPFDKFEKVVKIFNEVNKTNIDELQEQLNNMFDNLGKGFFYNETVYKVK